MFCFRRAMQNLAWLFFFLFLGKLWVQASAKRRMWAKCMLDWATCLTSSCPPRDHGRPLLQVAGEVVPECEFLSVCLRDEKTTNDTLVRVVAYKSRG